MLFAVATTLLDWGGRVGREGWVERGDTMWVSLLLLLCLAAALFVGVAVCIYFGIVFGDVYYDVE